MSNGLVCKPLLIKELREILRWTPIGIIVVGLLCWQTIPKSFSLYNNLATQFVSFVGVGATLVALAIGLLQSLGDSRSDARGFLLHRPISLRSIFTTKLIAGFIAYVVCLAPPLIVTAIRLDILGPEQLPVSSLDLLPLIVASLVIFLLHPAAMWASYRTARWIGTKTLPLVFAACGIMLAILLMLQASGWWLPASFLLIVVVWYLITVQAAWHAFSREAFLPSYVSGETTSASRAIGLFVACVALTMAVAVFSLDTLFRDVAPDLVTYDLAIESDGDLWEIQNVYRQGALLSGNETEKLGRRVSIGQSNTNELKPLPDDWERAKLVNFAQYGTQKWYEHFVFIGQIIGGDAASAYFNLVVHDGKIFVYGSQNGVAHIISPNGVFDPQDQPTGRFLHVRMLSTTTNSAGIHLQLERNPLLIANNGIFQLDLENRRLLKLIEAEVESAAIDLPETKGAAAALWTITSNRLSHYYLTSSDSGEPLEAATDPIISKTRQYPLPLLEADKVNEFAINTTGNTSYAAVAPVDNTKVVITSRSNAVRYRVEILSRDSDQANSGVVWTKASSPTFSFDPELYVVPPGVIGVSRVILYILRNDLSWKEVNDAEPFPRMFIVAVIAHALLASTFAFWISRRRGVLPATQIRWAVLGAIFGVVVLPAIIAIHGKLVYEPCLRCDNPRRIDTNRCGHCGADWDRLPYEGNEVIGSQKIMTAPASNLIDRA